jgi:2-oxoglutarate dehydrogenase E2 component (dihydrolipoamide succinyltransferase)
MAKVEIKLPKLGESISKATILKWMKSIGSSVEKDEALLEVATDKVDSEIAAPASGVISGIFIEENQEVAVGTVLGMIETDAETTATSEKEESQTSPEEISRQVQLEEKQAPAEKGKRYDEQGRFISPLVRSIAARENISLSQLTTIEGSGKGGRLLKKDMLAFIESGGGDNIQSSTYNSSYSGDEEIIEMDRMRSMIAKHMVDSKRISPHVTSYVEADVTKIVKWRDANKLAFEKKYGQKITFTPIFVEAVVKALEEFPLINVSVEGNKIRVKKQMNLGLATALPSGNLIVPVIRDANQKNLLGLAKDVNDLVQKARTNKLRPDEIGGSTFTISNVGTFRNIMGTPIINQPEVAILATGAIRKRAVVIEKDGEDMIAIRSMMYLSLSYDHRVVDGNLGGSFLARIMDHLEAFDINRSI